MAKRLVDFLTLEDVAYLYDGLQDDLPAGLAGRLSQGVRVDSQFTEPVGKLKAIAAEAGLPSDRPRRINDAAELHCDLRQLLEAGSGWQDPAEILDPDGCKGLDLAGLANLAAGFERRQDPPDGIAEVRRKVVRALAAEAAEVTAVETFVRALLERPTQAARLLLAAKLEFLARTAPKDDR